MRQRVERLRQLTQHSGPHGLRWICYERLKGRMSHINDPEHWRIRTANIKAE
jgi:hypothetical protein